MTLDVPLVVSQVCGCVVVGDPRGLDGHPDGGPLRHHQVVLQQNTCIAGVRLNIEQTYQIMLTSSYASSKELSKEFFFHLIKIN